MMLLALFPLQLALFPAEEIPLHIFEPRYKQLIAECRDEGITFGIPTSASGSVSKIGTEVSLVRILETYDTGEMDVVVRGERVFRIDTFQAELPGKLYSGARVTFQENDPQADPDTERNLIESYDELSRLLRTDEPDQVEAMPNLSFELGPRVGLSLEQRLTMLRMNKESDRQTFLLQHIEHAIHAIKQQRLRGTKLGGGNGSVRHVGD